MGYGKTPALVRIPTAPIPRHDCLLVCDEVAASPSSEKFSLFIVAMCADISHGICKQASGMNTVYEKISGLLTSLDGRFPSLSELSAFSDLCEKISSQETVDTARDFEGNWQSWMEVANTGLGPGVVKLEPIIPVIQKCIAYSDDGEPQGPSALFIAPTKELCVQINDLLVELLEPLPFLRTLNLSNLTSEEKSVWENDFAHFVDVRHLVLDEADLLLSFGYEEEMSALKQYLPPNYQCILTSATITDDMSALKSLFMVRPVLALKLKVNEIGIYH
ncbi:unnamed protein product [Cylicocyclus nassatus]|uniref:RNA helicase n=1 Tax=Cylicocyclus nassatus TaxID=53992 RepID=A0AA36DPL3_CYLNA|nr:unnamed protein product [Cylicocyclus nassatus]